MNKIKINYFKKNKNKKMFVFYFFIILFLPFNIVFSEILKDDVQPFADEITESNNKNIISSKCISYSGHGNNYISYGYGASKCVKMENEKITGYATYYGSTNKFQGRKTASGEKFDRNLMTCAANNYKFGTKLKITNLQNNKTVIVKVNDRMGSKKNIVDLSYGAFKKIANIKSGRIKISVEIIN